MSPRYRPLYLTVRAPHDHKLGSRVLDDALVDPHLEDVKIEGGGLRRGGRWKPIFECVICQNQRQNEKRRSPTSSMRWRQSLCLFGSPVAFKVASCSTESTAPPRQWPWTCEEEKRM